MTVFKPKWSEWNPRTPTPPLDKTDRNPASSPSVSFGNPSNARSQNFCDQDESEETTPKTAIPLADNTDKFEERAAIVEFDAGVPREWAEGYARLCTIPRHPDFTEKSWRRLIDDSGRFLDRWAVKVAAMGWTTQEVFGVHPDKPDARLDLRGLVPSVCGTEVVAVSADSATVQTPSGARQRIFRRSDLQSPGRVRIWELHPADSEVSGKPERNEGERR
jgi:hypothetical protein